MGGIADTTAGEPDGLTLAIRFSLWSARDARLALFAFFALLIASAMVPVVAGESEITTQGFAENISGQPAPERERDEDLALYDRAIERIQHGEHYYDFIVAEHRLGDYPVRPGVAVRLPTLAYIDAWLGIPGQIAASLDLNRHFFVLHELWSGMLLALAFGLHRPGKWGWSLAAAALAVAIREHALPFILLMAAMALWRRDWKQGIAWSALAAAFLAFLGLHLAIIAAQVLPSDPFGQGWLDLRGLSGWISYVSLSSNLRFLPGFIAGPLIVIAMLGWAAWNRPTGQFGFLLYGGYGLLFMIAGRPDAYYWGAMVAPAVLVGLAFALSGLRALIAAARREPEPQIRCA